MKDFDPADFSGPAPDRRFTIKNGDWACARCGGEPGAVLGTADGEWEVFVPNRCPTQQACSKEIAELAEFSRAIQFDGKQEPRQ